MIDQAYQLREYYKTIPVEKNKQQIISITSGKGGTGKSSLAFYLSQLLAQQGYKTLLVEFDFNLGSLAFHLGVEPSATIGDLFTGTALFEELPVKINNNFFVIFGDSGKLNLPENRITHIRNFFQQIGNKAGDFYFVIIDNGAGINNEIFETLKFSSQNLIVTLPDPVAIMDAYVMVKLMVKNSLPSKKGVIINRCSTDDDGKTAFENLSRATGHFLKEKLDLIGIVGEDKLLREMKQLDKATLNKPEQHGIITAIKSAADRLVTISQLANSHQFAKNSL